MKQLTFEEKFLINIFLFNEGIKIDDNNNKYFYAIKNDNIRDMIIKKILNNEELLQHLIYISLIKVGLDKNYNRRTSFLMDFESSIPKELYEYYINLKNRILSKYLKENFPEARKIVYIGLNRKRGYIIDNFDYFINVFEEKVKAGEIDKEQLNSLFDDFLKYQFYGIKIIFLMISNLRKNNNIELEDYLSERLETTIINSVNINFLNDKEIVINSIRTNMKRNKRGGLGDKELIYSLQEIFYTYKAEVSLSLTRTGDTYLSGLSYDQINNINIKNVKEIIEIANKKYFADYEEKNFSIFLKMYILFGKSRTIEIIQGKYGELSYQHLEIMFDSIDVSDYKIKKRNAEPSYDKEQIALINFLFASGVNDVNANIKKFATGEIEEENISFFRLISEWKIYYYLLGGNVTLSGIEEQMKNVSILVPPNLKEIEPRLKLAGMEHFSKIKEVYFNMQKRTRSTIPKISGKYEEYEYEMLDLTDPSQMDVGYLTHCCFTFGGASQDSLIHACTTEDSRVFVVKKNGRVVAQSWVWRIGNTVCFDNIEVHGVSKLINPNIIKVYEQASNEILQISNKNEPPGKQIQLVTVGTGYTDVSLKGEKIDSDQTLLPKSGLYTDASTQIIFAKSDDFERTLDYEVDPIYMDERKKMVIVDPQQASQDSILAAKLHIDKINYSVDSKNYKNSDIEGKYTFIMYGFDWFIGITINGDIIIKEYSFDERSKVEIKQALEIIIKKIKSGQLDDNLNDVLLDKLIKESTVYGK